MKTIHESAVTVLPAKEQKETFVREMFNAIAGRYDLMNSLMSMGLDKSWRRFAVQCAELKAGGNGLDICCGTGKLVMEQARVAGPGGNITGLDFSRNMLAKALEYIEKSAFRDTIQLIQGNAMKLPFADNTFDCITVGWGLRNVPDIQVTLREMLRVVKPGGKVVSLDMAQPSAPVFRQLYWFCFNKVIPLIGRLWAGNMKAYAYLHDSALVFPHQRELARMFSQAGFVETGHHDLAGGIVSVVEGRKTDGSC